MKMRLLVVMMVLGASSLALADTVTFFNTDGNFASNSGRTSLTLTSYLTGINGLAPLLADQSAAFPTCQPTCLGSVSIQTGAKTAGFLYSPSATFGSGGTITVTGTNFSFTGSIASGATWSCTPIPGAQCNGTRGANGGTLTIDGKTYPIMTAATVQLTTSGAAPIGGSTGPLTWKDAGGTTTFASPVPEPGTLGLVGSGLLGLSIFARRRSQTLRIP
jgi:hypothetical protein